MKKTLLCACFSVIFMGSVSAQSLKGPLAKNKKPWKTYHTKDITSPKQQKKSAPILNQKIYTSSIEPLHRIKEKRKLSRIQLSYALGNVLDKNKLRMSYKTSSRP